MRSGLLLAQNDVLDEAVFDPTPVSGWTILLAVVASLGLLVFVGLVVCQVRSAREDPGDRAFRLLSARMKLSGRARGLVREMAREAGVAPVGLLVSPGAMRSRLAEVRRTGRVVEEVGSRLG